MWILKMENCFSAPHVFYGVKQHHLALHTVCVCVFFVVTVTRNSVSDFYEMGFTRFGIFSSEKVNEAVTFSAVILQLYNIAVERIVFIRR